MITKDQLKEVVYEQLGMSRNLGIVRSIDPTLVTCPEILVLTGVRRCGKSTLMQQIRAQREDKDYFISFDDDRLLHFTSDDFQLLYDVFVEEFGVQHTFYFDEIQMIDGWERFVGRLYKQGDKVVVTGSNAKMLSRELGTMLTGRHVTQEVFPFSFKEYLGLRSMSYQKSDFYTTEGRAFLTNAQDQYLKEGGFPQYLQTGVREYLRALYNDIIYRDIIVRHNISSDKPLKETMYYLISNATHLFTYNSLAKAVGVKSSETIRDYIGYMEESYLVGQLNRFNYKVGEQVKSAKKCYFIDNGLVRQIGFSFSENEGARLENAVWLELRRRGGELYYYKETGECDFIVRNEGRITAAYQVSVSLKDENTRRRELAGLLAAMEEFVLSEGYIITRDETEEVMCENGKLIHVLPFYKWVL